MELLVLVVLIIVGYPTLKLWIQYNRSSYYIYSKNTFVQTLFSTGNIGEFHTFYKLERLSGKNKLLTNIYLTKEDGSTTEIDVIMISTKGIYVFESKNYSGWIFGNEKSRYWTQTLGKGKKNKFFNPIWQNKLHIRELDRALKTNDLEVFKSYIVFSERCTLKIITKTSDNVVVLKRNQLISHLERELKQSVDLFTETETDNMFVKLLDSRVKGETIKEKHIQQVSSKKRA